MGKGKKRISSQADKSSQSRIKPEERKVVLNDLIQFSFKFYDPNHTDFNCRGRSYEYFVTLLGRLKDLSTFPLSNLIRARPNQTTRFHRIDFTEDRVKAEGFGINQWEDINDDAWQFSLGANENGRVHGFLVENVFYIVWLDPNHNLYK